MFGAVLGGRIRRRAAVRRSAPYAPQVHNEVVSVGRKSPLSHLPVEAEQAGVRLGNRVGLELPEQVTDHSTQAGA